MRSVTPIHVYATALAAALLAPPSQAQTYPTRPVRMVIPFSPGGATDVPGRVLAQKLSEQFGQQVVVDNRPGAGSVVGTELVAHALADGYTILMTGTPFAVSPAIYRMLPYHPVKDFAPVGQFGSAPNTLVVHPTLGVRTTQELLALAKSQPGKLDWASSGTGGAQHLFGALFMSMAGIQVTHIPYKGSGPAISDLIGGQVALMFDTVASALPQIRAKKVKPLAVSMNRRSVVLPDVSTMDEAGVKGFEAFGWSALLAPAGSPKDIVQKLSAETLKVLNQPDLKERVVTLGFEPSALNPDELTSFMKAEIAKWGQAVKLANIRLE